MKSFLHKLSEMTARFMADRYGVDELSRALMMLGVICLITSNFTAQILFRYVALLSLLISLFRSCSKRIDRRTRERNRFMKMKDHVRYIIKLRKRMWNERKTHKYVKCDRCSTYFRVPRGKGTIIATCPNCCERIKIAC